MNSRGPAFLMAARTFLLMAALSLTMASTTTWAYRVIRQLEEAYEASLSDVSFPGSVTGSVTFRPCDNCAALSLRVTAETGYQIGETQLTRDDFLDGVDVIRESPGADDSTGVTIFFDIDRQRVSRILLIQY